ncbi:unnamed protein product [Nyctereutes procyonoides]|uniref:(raccoon dog) hypothetical protein n=1 Tax=Nyctereutes procyonoides TaxID=34880 RepID=A0A811YXN2_NYCPR|nr:unnamed protein product [Nyctereutes procyonoides]
MSGPNRDPGILVEAEYAAINSMLDQINSCLDQLENDHLHACLQELLGRHALSFSSSLARSQQYQSLGSESHQPPQSCLPGLDSGLDTHHLA